MALSIADIAQRTIVLTSVGLTLYGGILTAHGIGYRALKSRGYFGGETQPEIKPADSSIAAPPTIPS